MSNIDIVTLGMAAAYTNKVAGKLSGEIEKANGNIFVNNFMIMNGRVSSRKTAAEIEKAYLYFDTTIVCAMSACEFLGSKTGPSYTCTARESVSMKDEDGKSYYARKFYFGDNFPPIIVDAILNTITVDPDWVASTV